MGRRVDFILYQDYWCLPQKPHYDSTRICFMEGSKRCQLSAKGRALLWGIIATRMTSQVLPKSVATLEEAYGRELTHAHGNTGCECVKGRVGKSQIRA